MVLVEGLIFMLWPLSSLCHASPGDPWSSCPADKICKVKFANGACDMECSGSQCLKDGFDCLKPKESCNSGYILYCRDHFDNAHCEKGCNTAPCGWDGSDCIKTYKNQHPNWAKGVLILHTAIPFQKAPLQNSSLLWALSILLQTSVKLRGVVPLQPSADFFAMDAQQLIDLHQQAPNYKSNRSLLFLQVDNRPCSQLPFSCFPYASEAADFLNAMLELNLAPAHIKPEIQVLIGIRGINKEITVRETPVKEPDGSPAWLWPVVGIAVGIGVALAVVATAVLVWFWRRRQRREQGDHHRRVHHRSTATDSNGGNKDWTQCSTEQNKRNGRIAREKDRNGMKKKKKGKDLRKKRREPLGEDAIRIRPLKKSLDIGSDTDVTQSSMEDISKTICDHRSPDQKHFNINHKHVPISPPRRWDRNSIPTQQRTPSNSAPVQWCGPDGSVVLIRAVRSGLDRVVLELLRAGVPVNNTDHTGRSALHWACSVNHLSLARTLIRYGAAVDMQDHKGETALFLSALHGCYDTARFLILNGANQELTDCRGRRPIDVAQEGFHHEILELLLAHRVHQSPFPVAPATEVLWDDRTYLYSPWVASPPCLPGRSASFSGVVGPREMSSPQSSDWQFVAPQNWRPMTNQSATALVSPRVLSRPSRPISTLQEVTSEAEEEEREAAQHVPRATTPHFLCPLPAPRQRSFSCTQPALQRRLSANQPEPVVNVQQEKLANEQVEIVVVPHPKTSSSQSESRSAGTVCNTDSERERIICNAKSQSEAVNTEPTSVQTVM
ncbi:neurogenic locus notch homolog protein 1 isoform X1 [Ictalurus furcatus]|uniref:neurogenic locus notch homolog protein 1 isoform X1 n=2 Tax=Ictalurus furcatus TaxID=66913 RepID=UPI002350FE0A|nr:neurogenic locus notch homolog protein 1 isoform X1 [Ictalurus furcatus]XP_053468151.1 neurogenic locus notch homolog protein 1 isoform X1 [Ictalurus furcatus]